MRSSRVVKAEGQRCRLSCLTKSALVCEPNCGGGGGAVAGSQLSANEYSFTHGAQINFGDLTPYLAYGFKRLTANAEVATVQEGRQMKQC
jgi:hypothetical protein